MQTKANLMKPKPGLDTSFMPSGQNMDQAQSTAYGTQIWQNDAIHFIYLCGTIA